MSQNLFFGFPLTLFIDGFFEFLISIVLVLIYDFDLENLNSSEMNPPETTTVRLLL